MTTLRLYRAILKTARQFTADGTPLQVRLPVPQSSVQWIRHDGPQGQMQAERQADYIRELFPTLTSTIPTGDQLSGEQLTGLIRAEFRAHVAEQDPDKLSDLMDTYFGSLRILTEQIELTRRTSVTETSGVRVEATSEFAGMNVDLSGHPAEPVFQYRIRICNHGTDTVQVVGREWLIINRDGSIHASVPKGSPGVVGQTPVLVPGECFEYASGTTFSHSAGGHVEGSFQAVKILGNPGKPAEKIPFDVTVNPFYCQVPEELSDDDR
eukprot:TRINITY_DN14288_c0_g1_i1.p1 TRINITY_DN14288_c0_g1~~TRINITY_DN14288_c0_g1_i1.p1  ORF type:complete len:267 (+),score=26.53 TRINITY_DN14288_c0_g1_i1:174-974(+)